MRTAQEKVINVALSEKAIETPLLFNNPAKNNINHAAALKLIDESRLTKHGRQYGAKDIDKALILDLLSNIEVPASNVKFDPLAVHGFISQ